MKRILGACVCAALLAGQALADNSDAINDAVCAKEVKAKLAEWNSTSQWQRQVDPATGAQSYRSPTKTFGTWVEVQKHPAKSVVMAMSAKGLTAVTYEKSCEPIATTKKYEALSAEKGGKHYFTDMDLVNLVNSKKSGMIYVWSPGMVYSVDEFQTFKNTAKKLGLQFTVVMDPYADQKYARQIAQQRKLPLDDKRVESVELLMRNMGVHFPMTLVYHKGQLSRNPIIGVMHAPQLEKELRSQIAALN